MQYVLELQKQLFVSCPRTSLANLLSDGAEKFFSKYDITIKQHYASTIRQRPRYLVTLSHSFAYTSPNSQRNSQRWNVSALICASMTRGKIWYYMHFTGIVQQQVEQLW